MSKNSDLEFNERYNKIIEEYNNIIGNEVVINNLLSKFVVNGSSVGKMAYGDNSSTNSQIDLPTDTEEYKNALNAIASDIEDINSLINKINNLLEDYNQKE